MGRGLGGIRTEETRSLISGMKLRIDYVKMEGLEGSAYRIRAQKGQYYILFTPTTSKQ